jgi:hypothetical protein
MVKFKSRLFGEQWLESVVELKLSKHHEFNCLDFLKAYNLDIKDAPFYLNSFLSYQYLKFLFKIK